MKVSVFWFRRDLRLEDNKGLLEALNSGNFVLLVFIFDEKILDELPKNDARVTFIYQTLADLNQKLIKTGTSILILKGKPHEIWGKIIDEYEVESVYANRDYEPYAINRDNKIRNLLAEKGIPFNLFKDQVIFEENEIVKNDGTPYTVFTPYKNKWFEKLKQVDIKSESNLPFNQFVKINSNFPELEQLGFNASTVKVNNYDLTVLNNYDNTRNIPSEKTTGLSPHLRFGTVSIRKLVGESGDIYPVFLNELIWREFFMQILFHFPHVVSQNFKSQYNGIKWRNNESEFRRWCKGETGYPIVDAGMRELNATGLMHNRVRMITAGFLCKHLLIDWRWGEAYFAEKLLDYELSSNNGNWQWAAGTGCDAAPYFRIFNPAEQLRKFDKDFNYVKKWVPEFKDKNYKKPMVEHRFARERALETYQKGILK